MSCWTQASLVRFRNPTTSPGAPAHGRLNRLIEIVDLALAELKADDLQGAGVTPEAIQKKAAEQGLADITHAEADDVLCARLEQRRNSA